MNAVQEIRAALGKLQRLQSDSTPKPWHDREDDLTGEVDVCHDQEQRSHIANCGVAGMPRVEADAELIVTLHRTIDAQLAILEEGLRVATFHSAIIDKLDGNAAIPVGHALTLAAAINGGTR